MLHDRLAEDLYSEICRIPLVDSHTHIDPRRPTARNLADILGYHYYTELAHSAGMDKAAVAARVDPRERIRAIIYHLARFDNTVQHLWFVEIARALLGFQGHRLTLADAAWLHDTAARLMAEPDWEDRVLQRCNIEKVFLTNEFDDPLDDFNTSRYVPCLRTDDLVFRMDQPGVRQRLAKATGVEVGDVRSLRQAVTVLFERFTRCGARACAVSLPPDFQAVPVDDGGLSAALTALARPNGKAPPHPPAGADLRATTAQGVFWTLAENCQAFKMPFDLMIGVNRHVYEHGVHQGQDLFDQRTSLVQYAPLFNAFPDVTFCVSVLSSSQNQELVGYSWIFPNVVTHGHWWYANVPAYIERDLRGRLQAVPKTKQIGYYSDMYKLEFGLPKFNMYRRILTQVLADDYIRTHVYTEAQAVELARLLLRDNARRIFNV